MKARRQEPEWMDQPGLDGALHNQALEALRRVNRVSGTASRLWRAIRRHVLPSGDRPLRILDVASGGGDVAVGLALLARRDSVPIEVEGGDLSTTAVEHGQAEARRDCLDNVQFSILDALHGSLPTQYDVVTCSLFLHHLDDVEAVQLLNRMGAAARQLLLVDDLRRTPSGYALAWLGSRLLTRSPVAHADGPRSVRAAFTLDEAAELADRAGLAGYRVEPHWPERYLLSWRKLA